MRTETTKDQLEGLVNLLAEMLNTNQPEDIADDLVQHHVITAFNKLRIRSEQNIPRAGYKVSLTDQEARALYIFIAKVYVPEERYPSEAITLLILTNQIHEKYGFRIRTPKQHPAKVIGVAGGHHRG